MNEQINEFLASNNLSIRAKFIPLSKSRNKVVDDRVETETYHPSPFQVLFNKLTLNWEVTLVYKGKDVFTCDYSAGFAHCPSYKQHVTVEVAELCRLECEEGKDYSKSKQGYGKGKTILPNEADVIASFILDSDVLNYSSFKDWANSIGYDDDSIKAKAIYDQCLQHALAIRNGLGNKLFGELQEVFQNY